MDHINGTKRNQLYTLFFILLHYYVILYTSIDINCLNNYLSDQRNLGMSMKIERSTLEQVKARFATNKKKLEEKKKDYDLEQRVKELKEEVCFILCISFVQVYFIYYLIFHN